MIKRRIISLAFLAGLCTVACKKNETKAETANTDTSTVVTADSSSVAKPDSTKSTEYTGEKDSRDANVKNEIDGTYIAESCENRKFSIEIKNVAGKTTFKILNMNEAMESGTAEITGEGGMTERVNITLGKYKGSYEGDKIILENKKDGKENFPLCDGKENLEFTKAK